MGAEADCALRFKGKRATGHARLETEALQFRGGDLRLSIAFKEMSKVTANGGVLSVVFPGGTAAFELGEAAATWAGKIRNPPSRLAKIGATAEWRVSALGVTDEMFLQELEQTVATLSIGRALKNCDAIFFEADKAAALTRLGKLTGSIKPNGAIWVIRPRGRPEISERETMAAGKAAGLVDVKVVAFSATHTAEKFVIPVKARPKP
jgi:hypothetical protein